MNIAAFVDLPITGTALVAVILVLFAVASGAAYLVLRTFLKSVKLALKFAILFAFLVVIVVGSVAVWWYSTGTSKQTTERPAANKTRQK